MVTTAKQAKAVYGIAKNTGRVALDCEGCRLSRTGQLCLVQVSVQCPLITFAGGSKIPFALYKVEAVAQKEVYECA